MKGAVLCQGPSQSPPQFASVQQSSAQLHPLVLQPSLGLDIPGSGRCAWHEPRACWASGAALVLLGGALHSLALSRAEVVAHAGSTDWWTNKSFHLWLQQSAILQSLRLWVKRTSLSPFPRSASPVFTFPVQKWKPSTRSFSFSISLLPSSFPPPQSASLRVQGRWKGKEPGAGNSSPAGSGSTLCPLCT